MSFANFGSFAFVDNIKLSPPPPQVYSVHYNFHEYRVMIWLCSEQFRKYRLYFWTELRIIGSHPSSEGAEETFEEWGEPNPSLHHVTSWLVEWEYMHAWCRSLNQLFFLVKPIVLSISSTLIISLWLRQRQMCWYFKPVYLSPGH